MRIQLNSLNFDNPPPQTTITSATRACSATSIARLPADAVAHIALYNRSRHAKGGDRGYVGETLR